MQVYSKLLNLKTKHEKFIHIFSVRIECVFFLKLFFDFSIIYPLSSVIGVSKG